MTKHEIARQIAGKRGIEKEVVLDIVEELMRTVKHKVAAGETVYLRGFGCFAPRLRKAKIGRDISRGTFVEIPEHVEPDFKPSPDFKKLLYRK